MKALPSIILAAMLALPGLGHGAPQLPDMGDPASQALSPAQEKELGRQMMAEIRRRLPLLEDPEIVAYVRDVGTRLLAHADVPDVGYEFFVVDDPAINAFALPGGYIGVNTGLLINARRESEMAAVLAHEISHVSQRHIARSVAASERLSLQTAALVLTGLILGTQNGQAGSAAVMAGMAGSVQQQLNFSRAFEQEADALGIRMLAAAGYDPLGMPTFFDRLMQTTRYSDHPPEYLSTHPVTQSRIAESSARAEGLRPRKVFESDAFQLMRAKVVALRAAQPSLAVAEFEGQLKKSPEQASSRYGLALSLMAEREFDKARPLLEELIRRHGEQQPYLLALARLERDSGHMPEAVSRFRQAYTLYPDSFPARYYYADALIAAGKPAEAYHLLSRKLPSSEPSLYWLLAKAASEAHLAAEPQLAMAEYHYLRGDLGAAILQLRQALSDPAASPHQIARAAARRDELQREYEQQVKGG